jgi:hypothetical protein
VKEAVKYIMIGCLMILALFHIYYDGSVVWKFLYFTVEYFALSILLLYISYMFRQIFKQRLIIVEKGDSLFFGILSLYFIYKLWHNAQFYYPILSNGAKVQDINKWSIVTTIVVICVLFCLQIPIYIKYVKKR